MNPSDYLLPYEAGDIPPPAPVKPHPGMQVDEKALRRIAAEAIRLVPGVLGTDAGLSGLLRSADDWTGGIQVEVGQRAHAQVTAKIIIEYGKNIPEIAEDVMSRVTRALDAMAGVQVDKVNVEVTDAMTREEYERKTAQNQPKGEAVQ